MSWSEALLRLISPFLHPFLPGERLFAPYVLTSIFIALGAYLYMRQRRPANGGWMDRRPDETRGTFWAFAFPAEIWRDRATWLDFRFFLVNKAAFALLFAPMVVGGRTMESAAARALGGIFGAPPMAEAPAWIALGVTTIFTLLLMDFCIFLAHYLQHKAPPLWAFHKVHHSLEKMTPLAAFRMHPIDDLGSMVLAGAGYGLALGACRAIFGPLAGPAEFAGVHLGLVAFFLAGFHLRHSHIWLRYPGLLGRIFVSPAAHQIHHSFEDAHLDKNFGFVFSIWDQLFGSYHAPQTGERFRIGLTGGESVRYRSIFSLYINPFRDLLRLAGGRRISGAARDKNHSAA